MSKWAKQAQGDLREQTIQGELGSGLRKKHSLKGRIITAIPVRDIQAPINSSFKSTKHPGSSGGPCQPYVQEGPERSRRTFHTFNIVLITIDLFCTSVDLMKVQFG